MPTHKLECQHCGEEFESSRSDAKYCSNSCKTRASQIKAIENPVLKIAYERPEFDMLCEKAEDVGLTVEELVKYKSLMTATDMQDSTSSHEELEIEVKELKAKLSMFANTDSEGVFLKLNRNEQFHLDQKLLACDFLKDAGDTLEKKIIYATYGFPKMLERLDEAHTIIFKNGLAHLIKGKTNTK